LTLAALSHRRSTGDSGQSSCTAHYIASKIVRQVFPAQPGNC
jgi:hypothetical protein